MHGVCIAFTSDAQTGSGPPQHSCKFAEIQISGGPRLKHHPPAHVFPQLGLCVTRSSNTALRHSGMRAASTMRPLSCAGSLAATPHLHQGARSVSAVNDQHSVVRVVVVDPHLQASTPSNSGTPITAAGHPHQPPFPPTLYSKDVPCGAGVSSCLNQHNQAAQGGPSAHIGRVDAQLQCLILQQAAIVVCGSIAVLLAQLPIPAQ